MSQEMMNKSARLYGQGDLRLEESPVPVPGTNQVVVSMAYVGICRSDVHFFDEGGIDRYIVRDPVTLGHEMSGTIYCVGPGVTNVKVGDRVSVDPNRPCMDSCRMCNMKKKNICQGLQTAGLPGTDGGLARFMLAPAWSCHVLPKHVSLVEGAGLEPLAIAVHGLRRGYVTKGEVVVVIGAGPVGLMSMQAAKAWGAGKVAAVDVNEQRLALAKDLGADVVFCVDPTQSPESNAEGIKAKLGCEADVCLECSGAHGAVDTCIFTCRPGSRVVMLGFGEMHMNVALGTAAAREIDIIGSLCNNLDFPDCVELVSSGKVKVQPLVTHVLTLKDIKDGLDLVRQGNSSIKVMIDCQK